MRQKRLSKGKATDRLRESNQTGGYIDLNIVTAKDLATSGPSLEKAPLEDTLHVFLDGDII